MASPSKYTLHGHINIPARTHNDGEEWAGDSVEQRQIHFQASLWPTMMVEKWEVVMDACLALSEEGRDSCIEVIRKGYPFDPRARPREVKGGDRHPERDGKADAIDCWADDHYAKMRVFCRDGFINRFTGEPLIFPAVLRLLSKELPRDFPFQQYWRPEGTHIAYHEMGALVTHLVPLSRGGKKEEENLVTTTMPYLLARTDKTIEESGWRLTWEGFVDEWDGMSTWYVDYVKDNEDLRDVNFLNLWFNAAKSVLRL